MKTNKTHLNILAICSLFIALFIISTTVSAQSFEVNWISDMCDSDGEAEIILTDMAEPVSAVWYNQELDETWTGLNPNTLKDGFYLVTLTDANGVEYESQSLWINATIWWFPEFVPPAPCPGGTSSALVYIGGENPDFDVYIDGELNGSTSDDLYTSSPLSIGSHPCYIIDSEGCRSGYSSNNQETDSGNIVVYGETDLEIDITWEEGDNCGVYDVSYEIIEESTGPYVIYWEYWFEGEIVQVYADELSNIPNNTWLTLKTTDADGCEIDFNAWLTEPNVLQAFGTAFPALCPNDDGSIQMTVYGGTAPYTYSWSNGANTEDITGLAYGSYTLTATDAEGCTNTFTKYVGNSSEINVTGTVTPPNCEENIAGDIDASINGGVMPYSFSWSTGENTEDIAVNSFGYYTLTVTDAEGCIAGDSYYIPISDPCYSYVTGTTYYDLDGNCDVNGDDFALQSYVQSTNGNYAYNLYNNGNYSARFLEDVELTASSNGYSLICPTDEVALSYVPNTTYPDVDFYLQPDVIEDDACVSVWSQNPVPGFYRTATIYLTNPGTTIVSGTVNLEYSTLIDFVTSTSTVASVDEDLGLVSWNVNNLLPNSYRTIYITFYTDPTVELGEEVMFDVTLDGITNDVNLDNNSSSTTRTVVGSYDPNDKQVFPEGEGETHMIDPLTEELIYTIRFQNTGTAPAINVVIQDELDDSKFDISSAQVISTSHDLTDFTIDGTKAYFAFEDINLPDSTFSEALSQGYVTFKINLLESLPLGTVVENTAGIYFDFNAPIITNTSFVTLDLVESVNEVAKDESLKIYPNPSTGNLTLRSELGIDEVRIFDLSGRVVWSKVNLNESSTVQISIPKGISSGVYSIQTVSGNTVTQSEFVLTK